MRAILLALLLLTVAVAGCTGDDEDPGPTPTGTGTGTSTATGTTTRTGTGTGSGTGTPGPATATIDTFAADATSGEAPFEVTFTLDGSSTDPEANWTIEFGDGEEANGRVSDLPATVAHTYVTGGTFDASASISFGDGEQALSEAVRVSVTVPQGEAPQLEFTYGESLGCAGDILSEAGQYCVSASGPDASGIDGFWQPLDDRYWGRSFTTTAGNQLGDSDCDFADADQVFTGNANNGGGPCEGVVPDGTAWMFLYSYAEPSTGMTLTFS